jgi:hypothetical protein
MASLGSDAVGRIVALVAGLAIGLRAMQVVRNFATGGGWLGSGFGQGTVIGLVATIVLVGGLAAWRLASKPGGSGGPRLLALDAGMVMGGVVGSMVFRVT